MIREALVPAGKESELVLREGRLVKIVSLRVLAGPEVSTVPPIFPPTPPSHCSTGDGNHRTQRDWPDCLRYCRFPGCSSWCRRRTSGSGWGSIRSGRRGRQWWMNLPWLLMRPEVQAPRFWVVVWRRDSMTSIPSPVSPGSTSSLRLSRVSRYCWISLLKGVSTTSTFQIVRSRSQRL